MADRPAHAGGDHAQARVDVILAVHDVRRNIARAVASVLVQGPDVHAVVVCHNLHADAVAHALGELAQNSRVRFQEHHDGLASPSGPFNAGIAASRADWVSILGSDDELAPGAVAAWLTAADNRTDAVIARLVRGHQHNLVRSPPVRPGRRRNLDGAKDRLSYRSAPLGLIRRAAVTRLSLNLEEGARNGGDLPFVTALWFRGRVDSAFGGPPYIEHADAPVRVTTTPKPAAEELNPVRNLLTTADLIPATRAGREALAAKLFRRNIRGAILKRDSGRALHPADRAAIAQTCGALIALAPRLPRFLSRADAQLLTALTRTAEPDAVVAAFLAAENLRSPGALLPADPRMVWHREAPLRYVLASVALR